MLVASAMVALLSACGGSGAEASSPIQQPAPPPIVAPIQQPVPEPIPPQPQEPAYRPDTVIDVSKGSWVILGSSTAAGVGAPSGKGWASIIATRFTTAGANFVNLAKGSTGTYHGLSATRALTPGRPAYDPSSNIDIALSYRPNVVILAYPTNDTLMGYAVEETVKNLLDMRAMALEREAQVIVLSTQPRNLDAEKRMALQKINVQLKSVITKCFVDVYSALADQDGRLKSTYDSGDGTHPNAEGHVLISTLVQQLVDSNNCVRLKQ